MSDQESVRPAPISSGRPTVSDMIFLGFLACVLVAVALMGAHTFQEGRKTEAGKAQAEALMNWLSSARERRTVEGFEPSSCASVSADPAKPPTWADCARALLSPGGPLETSQNVFSGQPLSFLARCEPSSYQSRGQLVLEKISATPPGSAVSSITTALKGEDPIDKTLTIKVTFCGSSGYLIKIGEVEF